MNYSNITGLTDEETLYRVAELFKIFGDPTRVRILHTLFHKELCVQDIADTLEMSQSAISHQLRILKQSALVKFRREGKTIYYSLADDHVATILMQGLEHVCE
ncbi:MAG: metalloregulator ArsR/SmtB family transcription factor [Lachnospiraceae bacterium]|nr:metalloregulator ArsR/SmtB family transcription factor [Lachnospiraceae bacterium]